MNITIIASHPAMRTPSKYAGCDRRRIVSDGEIEKCGALHGYFLAWNEKYINA